MANIKIITEDTKRVQKSSPFFSIILDYIHDKQGLLTVIDSKRHGVEILITEEELATFIQQIRDLTGWEI